MALPVNDVVGSVSCRVVTDPQDVASWCRDTSGAPAGTPVAVVLAETVEDVSAALRWATRHRVPVSVRGAGTGLAGGANAYDGGLVVSLAGLDRIRGVDPDDRVAEVEAGVVTADLDRAARAHGLMYPPDPASLESSTIGGNIATDAGGLRCLKYGVTRDWVAGLEVVLADGRIIRTGGRTRKDTAGYHLTGLFVGSEGTLGVVTAATLRLLPLPAEAPVTFRAAYATVADAGAAVSAIMRSPVTPEVLEFLDAPTIEALEAYRPGGLERGSAAVLIGRLAGEDVEGQWDVVSAVLGGTDHGATSVVRASAGEGERLLAARRLVSPAMLALGPLIVCDVAVPPSRLVEILAAVDAVAAASGLSIATAGHAGDGNIHPVIMLPADDEGGRARAAAAARRIAEEAVRLGGTVTGEHGIGIRKHDLLSVQLDETALAVHRAVKAALDPLGILTPGRVI